VQHPYAREFYEAETLRDGWTIRQLNRQIASQFYEHTAYPTQVCYRKANSGGFIQRVSAFIDNLKKLA